MFGGKIEERKQKTTPFISLWSYALCCICIRSNGIVEESEPKAQEQKEIEK